MNKIKETISNLIIGNLLTVKDKKVEILSNIKSTVREVDKQAEVILFGSQSRDEENEHSDWDILILSSKPTNLKNEQTFRHKLFELELIYGVALSTFVYSKTEWKNKHYITPFYQNIQKDGIKL